MSIIRLFRSRRHGADRFERFAREHVDALYRLAFRLCESADGAEELVQELLVKLYPRIDELEALASPRPWLARSLYHLYVDGFRRQRRELAVISHEETELDNAADEATPGATLEQAQLGEAIGAALRKLNEDQRLVVLLHDLEGYTQVELADMLSVPVGTIKSRLNRARRALRDEISREPFVKPPRVNTRQEPKR